MKLLAKNKRAYNEPTLITNKNLPPLARGGCPERSRGAGGVESNYNEIISEKQTSLL